MKQIFALTRLIRTALPALIGVLAASAALADSNEGRYHDHHGMMDWGGWIVGPIMLLIFIGLLVGAVVLVLRLLGPDGFRSSGQAHDRAHAILRERFAKGEISQEEFEAAKKTLD